jgi:hypothetical protein
VAADAVCKAARVGAKEFISTLPGLVVCGGSSGGIVQDVWSLDRSGDVGGYVWSRGRTLRPRVLRSEG